MIEAVNSVLANAALSREATSRQADLSLQVAASKPSTPQAPYISPFIALDGNSKTAVIQIRDSDTGDVLTQYPSESRVRELQAQQKARLQSSSADTQYEFSDTSSSEGQGYQAPVGLDVQSIEIAQSGSDFGRADIAQAQLASVALSNAPSSGGAVANAVVNVTA